MVYAGVRKPLFGSGVICSYMRQELFHRFQHAAGLGAHGDVMIAFEASDQFALPRDPGLLVDNLSFGHIDRMFGCSSCVVHEVATA